MKNLDQTIYVLRAEIREWYIEHDIALGQVMLN